MIDYGDKKDQRHFSIIAEDCICLELDDLVIFYNLRTEQVCKIDILDVNFKKMMGLPEEGTTLKIINDRAVNATDRRVMKIS